MKKIAALVALLIASIPAYGQCPDGKCAIQRPAMLPVSQLSQAPAVVRMPTQAPQAVAAASGGGCATKGSACGVRASKPRLFGGRLFGAGLFAGGCCGK